MDGEGWKEVVFRKTTAAPPNGRTLGQHIPLRTGAKNSAKPPAVLVKLAVGSSYADTIRAFRLNSELNLVELGAQVTGMRKTRDGYLIVKGAGSVVSAQKLLMAISTRLGDAVGGVSRLSQYTVVEIVDIDEVTTIAGPIGLRVAIPEFEDDQATICERQAMQITDLWPSGQFRPADCQTAAVSSISRVPIGWTICSVRPRRPEPEKYYRFHGFGHQSGYCSGRPTYRQIADAAENQDKN